MKNRKFVIVGYLDADFSGSVDERESTWDRRQFLRVAISQLQFQILQHMKNIYQHGKHHVRQLFYEKFYRIW